ncbi:MAG: cytochrome c3 family protein [candidate division Zixibacteria bacterium]|nr:cytochrome c3 family protein [candidate division Zixibacteria bacterium]
MKKIGIVLAIVACVALVTGPAWGQDSTKTTTTETKTKTTTTTTTTAAKHQYVGETKCKMCHKAEYESWMTTKHAKAWASLKPEEQKKAECNECHMTGKTASDSILVNVGCESCHGPGSDYKAMNTMKNAKLAAEAGLMPITEETCTRCHNKKSPNFKEFDFNKAKDPAAGGVHKHTPKATKG